MELRQAVAKVSPQAVELLCRITGQRLEAQDVTPPVLFLASLATVLLGVMIADQTVTEAEKQRWQKSLNRFIPAEGTVRQLAQLFSKGIRDQKIYADTAATLTLLNPLSESERLLLMGFGYEMSVADGAIAESERQYLRQLGSNLGLKPSHLEVLEAGFAQQSFPDAVALEEVKSLLDPARFHELDTLFIKAASDLLSALPTTTAKVQGSPVATYQRLKEFQISCQQLDILCSQLHEIARSGSERGLLADSLVEDIAAISRRLQSQRFRVAVVGEFSQGKSTLLNALLEEEIQPVRAIPCSGTVTILRYGEKKRVLCCYKDGRQEEVAVDQYKEKSSISKAAALEHHGDELANSELEEIIFEHPDLVLCRSGVEIVDSPGLNEHPYRSAITEKLLQNTDAAIFITNAARLLPEKEKELLLSVRARLTRAEGKLPAANLFVLVNFMDLLDNDEDCQDVKQRLEEFIAAENLVDRGQNRIHYISAKAALKKQDEYLQTFKAFTQAIEQFLTVERGTIVLERAISDIERLIEMMVLELQQAKSFLEGRVVLSESEVHKILEQIGEASGRDVKIQILSKQTRNQVVERTSESWEQWVEGLTDRLSEKVGRWSSEHSALWSRDKLIADYTQQFNRDLSSEIDSWVEIQLKQAILQPALNYLDNEIQKDLKAIQYEIKTVDELKKFQDLLWLFQSEESSDFGDSGLIGNFGLAGLGAAMFVPVVLLAGPILLALGSLVAGGLLGTGVGGVLGTDAAVKAKVFEKGCEQFAESLNKTFENIDGIIDMAFHTRLERVDEIISRAVSLYETLLIQQSSAHQKNLEQREVNASWIDQKQLELRTIKSSCRVTS